MTHTLLNLVDRNDFRRLFIEHLGWENPTLPPVTLSIEDNTYTLTQVAGFSGLRVWYCNELPPRRIQRLIDQELSRESHERLVIFGNDTHQEWRWPRRAETGGTHAKLIAHTHAIGQPDSHLESQLEVIRIGFDEEPTLPEILTRMREAFDYEAAESAVAAAKLMAELYVHLDSTGFDEHHASVFLVRTLFCLYADDSDLWQRDLFTRYIEERTNEDGSDLGEKLADLYQALNQPREERPSQDDELIQAFPYVNGSVFGEATETPTFTKASRELLLKATYFNWAEISPAIFGSLFQAVKDKGARRELGAHYTTEENILKAIRPLFLDELEQAFTKAYDSKKSLEELLKRLGELNILDPACGCGNFLIISYRELRGLELRIYERLQELDPKRRNLVLDAGSLIHVKLKNFHGIEIEEWPATIAKTAMFFVEHQANQALSLALGYAFPMLPLSDSARIVVENALTLQWETVIPPCRNVIVVGNPPFLGDRTRSAEQLEELRAAWGGSKQLSRMDYVTGWHAKTLELFSNPSYQGEWAFVTTNSITQGDQVPRIFTPIYEDGWRIKFAHRTFSWSSEAPGAAAVHCVIVGFTKTCEARQRLFDYPNTKGDFIEYPVRTNINSYLLDAPKVLVEKRSTVLSPELNLMEYGSKATDDGNLIVEPEDYEVVMADPIASRYVHKYIGARELLHNESRWCLWLEDATQAEINDSPILRSRVQAVKKFRQSSQARSTRDYPYPHLFRQLAKQQNDFVCVPRVVSENRKYFTVAHLDHSVICSDSVFQCSDPDGFQFSILSSSMFITWQKAIGGRLESRLRFASTLTWYTFPLPEIKPELRGRIIDAGKEIRAARALHPEWSLATHYKIEGMAPELESAHAKLDLAVDEAFGVQSASLTSDERISRLFDYYTRMVAAE